MGNTWLGSTEGALLIGWYLIALKTECAFYIFAVGLGLARLATVLRTAAIVGKLFGIRCLATTLFGLTLLPDQIGGTGRCAVRDDCFVLVQHAIERWD